MLLFTSESVSAGHPDKLCDQISDAILDAYLSVDPDAKVAAEVFATGQNVIVGGEISSTATVNLEEVVKGAITKAGFRDEMGYSASTVNIQIMVSPQSPEIHDGVFESAEVRNGTARGVLDTQGAGDQGLMFGYASKETENLMPLPIAIANALIRKQAEYVNHNHEGLPQLWPDAKAQVTVVYDNNGYPMGIDTVLMSTQHPATVSVDEVREFVEEYIFDVILSEFEEKYDLNTVGTKYIVNPAGSFVVGGPVGDAGLTGRKIIVDTYGGMARHGGGAFSGKDSSKVDRSAAYATRWVAKHIVASGLAEKAEVQVSYAIGQAHPVAMYVDTMGTGIVSDSLIQEAVEDVFDLRPMAIVKTLGLKAPVFSQTSVGGHFDVPTYPWEIVDDVLVDALIDFVNESNI